MTEVTPCPGCGLPLPPATGPTHATLNASPACWALYRQVMAAEYADPDRWPIHGLTFDAYAAQHAGSRTRAGVRLVGVHLVALSLVVERGLSPERAARVRVAAEDRLGEGFTWLEPPARPAPLTLRSVADASDAADHRHRVYEWARSVWASWTDHHATIHRWVDWLVAASPPELAASLPSERSSHGST